MSLSTQFRKADNIYTLAQTWTAHLTQQVAALGSKTSAEVKADGAVSLIAPAALVAQVLQQAFPEAVDRRLRVLLVTHDQISVMDNGVWLNYAAEFAGLEHGLDLSCTPYKPVQSNLYPTAGELGLPELPQVSFADAQNQIWDLMIWIHPCLENVEGTQEAELANAMLRGGVPVYAAMYNELDALVQTYGISDRALEFSWLDASCAKQPLSKASVNRFGIATGDIGVDGGWGAVLTKLQPATETISADDWEMVKLAMTLIRLDGAVETKWGFSEHIAGVAFNNYKPVGLIGNMAVDSQTGLVLSRCSVTEVLKVVGHLPQELLDKLPSTPFRLVAWAARVKLLFTSSITREDRKRKEGIEILQKAFSAGMVEAGIALGRIYEHIGTASARLNANGIYARIGVNHYMSAYALGHKSLEDGRKDDALAFILAASQAGYPPAMTDYAICLLEDGETLPAVELLEAASKQGDKEASFRLGEVLIQSGLYQEALKELRQAWSAGHDESLSLADWLCDQMLAHSLGKTSAIKRERKEIKSAQDKLLRYQAKLDAALA